MTKEQVTVIKDNLTKEVLEAGEAVEVEFTVHGQAYRMDLSKQNADDFYALLKEYEDAAEKVDEPEAEETPEPPKPPKRNVKTLNPGTFESSTQVREWAREKGGALGEAAKADGGRLPNVVIEAWNQAHPIK